MQKKPDVRRGEVAFIFAIILGLIIGILIKKVRLGILLGVAIGAVIMFLGWIRTKPRDAGKRKG